MNLMCFLIAGYYTETYQGVEQQGVDSTDIESEEEGRYTSSASTFLPANFPTFDSPGSSPRPALLQLGEG
jgi:hypothetical protein